MSKLDLKNFIIPGLVLLGLIAAALFWLSGRPETYTNILMTMMVIGTAPVLWRMTKDLLNAHFGIDIIAVAAIAGAFLLNQFLAGTVILLMLSGGEALEAYALQRARRELTALLSRVPTVAHKRQGGEIIDVAVAQIKVEDTLIIKPGEVVPADGIVLDGASEVDESAITGESVPVEKRAGSLVYSGSVNDSGVLEIRATKPANESTYEKIINLVKQASESRAPMVRLADRYSVWFTAVTFIIALAAWQMAHDPIRLLSVLVVATPCPLILATPIAIMSGVSKSASRGIIVKSGGALEKLAEVNAFIFDKTGTLTLGAPEVTGVKSYDGDQNQILKYAASLDQLSNHILARSLLAHAKKSNLDLNYPNNFQEKFGDGVQGELDGRKYLFGKLAFLQQQGISVAPDVLAEHEQYQKQGKIAVYLAAGGQLQGAVLFADVVRPEIANLFSEMKMQKLDKIVMLTGDKKNVAELIGQQLGLTDIHAECLPEDKVKEVQEHKKEFGSVAMVGDGVNDAPALAAADVGVAIGGHGSTASSESGDIVVTVDDLSRVGQALKIARATLKIAKQSIFVGIGVSILLMIIAAFGHIIPVYGALLQEGLDVLVILNALRVNFVKI
ncbi:MAG: heavy metal translocating P-type ATPase [Patescibacteria group bacterium]|nr:heavy metal translocating P-type ATPase [Patescibacteria group bacterium]